ncbi:hypothetical protein Phi17218_175 [Cellulophaga phage phi17:2_18]|uniref:Uncharacterized protein n=2 Tax=Lightbulbvirus Cba172 TaxID=1918525 RepID=S0A0F9_9CAUD|nr:hypothetical protein Phi17:2_gp175 [Cellulophaga phage phi17:2]AGO47708.1 hypothetical protein Phi17:2_gp175 [Cellulophaga phage phi17:2]ALO80578.1 hypothetical protein Phi17218_175 [Cellulophaga phage phi17:2_18]
MIKEREGRYFKECNAVMMAVNKNNAPKEGEFCICDHRTNLGCGPRGESKYLAKTISGKTLEEIIISKYKHLYLTVDEEIKEGDCVLYNQKEILQVQMVTSESYHFTNGEYEMKTNIFLLVKIIATTDTSLTKKVMDYSKPDKYDAGNEMFKGKPQYKKEHLPSPSQAFIKKYCELGGIDEVLVEYELDDRNMLPFSDTNYPAKLKTDSYNTITIKSVEEKTYSKSELQVLKSDIQHLCTWYQGRDVDRCERVENWIKENL